MAMDNPCPESEAAQRIPKWTEGWQLLTKMIPSKRLPRKITLDSASTTCQAHSQMVPGPSPLSRVPPTEQSASFKATQMPANGSAGVSVIQFTFNRWELWLRSKSDRPEFAVRSIEKEVPQ
jgi:hypothetical protein